MGASEAIEWQGERLELFADRALHWPRGKTLFISDPHFGKAAAFRSVGIAVPGNSCAGDCGRLSQLLNTSGSERLVVLGDFLHSGWGRSEVLKRTLLDWRTAHPDLQIDLVRGNHDLHAGDPWRELNIACHPEPWSFAPWTCRHEPGEGDACLAGHVHPAVSFAGERASCFWIQTQQMVLPAFGEFTGTHVIEPASADRIFATDGTDLVEIPIGH